jgi:cephalosporin-C deacetylase
MSIRHDFPFDPTYGYTLDKLLQIEPPPEPSDFVDFWQETYREALRIPLRIERRQIVSSDPAFETHEIEFDSWEGVRIGGWITVPVDGIFDFGLVLGHGYGGRGEPGYWPRAITMAPCARGFNRSLHPRFSNNPMQHVLVGLKSRETYVHRGCVVDFCCAVSTLIDCYPAAAARLFYRGGSFGGGIGAHLLAWDPRFHKGVLDIPSFGHYPLRVQLPCVGSGQAIRRVYLRHPEILDVLAYYDAASAARHINVPTMVAPALFDPAVPPPGQFAVANSIRAPRELFIRQAGHYPHPNEIEEAKEYERINARWFAED